MAAKPLCRRLKPKTVAMINDQNAWPSRDAFMKWFQRAEGLTLTPHWWKFLKRGESVPSSLVHGLIEYLSKVRNPPIRLSLNDDAEFAEHIPLSARDEGQPKIDIWRGGGWRTLFGHLPSRLTLPEEAMCSRNDIEMVARMALENLGRKITPRGDKLSPEVALANGERKYEIDWQSYAKWLCQFWEIDALTILLATIKGQPIGATIVFPISENAYNLYSRGAISAFDMTAPDFERPSKWLHLQTITQVRPSECPNTRARSLAQVHCILYQMAAFSHPMDMVSKRPIFIAPAINPENINRCQTYGFRETGITTPRPRCHLIELRPPGYGSEKLTFEQRIIYRTMLCVVGVYQESILYDNEMLSKDE
ncbi:hypothetical protein [Fimbriiglobus ruber]|uniref:hypothetical protein n=1 Tax=Fimbriiglobus ruber TaxID=1908690 RepID=UPI001179E230|nr:hypothetical protein [Fimbriiglobus ruber]